jgi:hypothetical protein
MLRAEIAWHEKRDDVEMMMTVLTPAQCVSILHVTVETRLEDF